MFTGSFSRNTHGQAEDASSSPVPGSKSVYVRDIDDVKDAFHGNYESPKLDTRADRGSLRWAVAATVAAIAVGIGVLAVLGFASGIRLNRIEVPAAVLEPVSCASADSQVVFTAGYNEAQGAKFAALTEASGLEIEVRLLDELGVLVATKTAWLEFGTSAFDLPDTAADSNTLTRSSTTSVTFDEAVLSPSCETTVWAA